MTVKTTLVPGVAWPYRIRKPKVIKGPSKIARTDANFEAWVKKQSQPINLQAIFGDKK